MAKDQIGRFVSEDRGGERHRNYVLISNSVKTAMDWYSFIRIEKGGDKNAIEDV